MRQTKNKKGFTLVELVVVMAIFGIIMGALLNLIKPANTIYNNTDATLHTNMEGTALVDAVDNELRYATNVLVLKDYAGVPNVSAAGTIGTGGVKYNNVLILDNQKLRGYSTTAYSGDDTDSAQKRMGATGCIIKVSKLDEGGLNFDNSDVMCGVDFYSNYKYDINAGISKQDQMYTLDLSIAAYQPAFENGAYIFEQTRFTKEASVNLKNINIDPSDQYVVRGYVDYSDPATEDYITYPRASAGGSTAQQQAYYSSATDNTYTYIFYNKQTTSSVSKYTVTFVYDTTYTPNPGGTIGSPVQVVAGNVYKGAPTLPKLSGCGDAYWLNEAGDIITADKFASDGQKIDANCVFTAVYPSLPSKTQYVVTYMKKDGSVDFTNMVYENDLASIPGSPSDIGIDEELVGWNTKADGTGNDILSFHINNNSVCFYPLIQKKAKVEFEIEGTIDSSLTTYVSKGTTCAVPATVPTSSDADKMFDYWVEKGGSNKLVDVTSITGDTIFEAVFKDKPSTPTPSSNETIYYLEGIVPTDAKQILVSGWFNCSNIKVTEVTEDGTEYVLYNEATSFIQNHLKINSASGKKAHFVITITAPQYGAVSVKYESSDWAGGFADNSLPSASDNIGKCLAQTING